MTISAVVLSASAFFIVNQVRISMLLLCRRIVSGGFVLLFLCGVVCGLLLVYRGLIRFRLIAR